MNLYYEMLQHPVFNIKDVLPYCENVNTARSAVARLLKSGLALKIRNNMYTCISGETSCPVADRYQIASHISDSSCISYHTAMEYHGAADQVYYDVYVTSATAFNDFAFDGYIYHYCPKYFADGVITPAMSGGIRVTDLERTVIDCIKEMDRIAGIEETLANISTLKTLSAEKLLSYLSLYQNQFLYQKTGFILEHYKNRFLLPDDFFDECRKMAGSSKRYFTNEKKAGIYNKEWKLVVPEGIFNLKNGADDDSF